MPATCPTGSIQSFPLKLGFAPTAADYERAHEGIHIDVSWAPRTTAPVFNTDELTGYTDEGTSELSNKTTMRYNGRQYRLLSVQVCASTHTEWLIPAVTKDINKYDFIVTFQSIIDSTNAYVMLVMPLLSTGAIDPSYLMGLVDTADANTVYSLQDCFPNPDANFAMYSTCLIPMQANASYKTMDVFVCYDGSQITADMQNALETALNTGAPYISTVDSGLTRRLSSLTNQGDFVNKVMTTRSLLNPKGGKKRSVEGFQTPPSPPPPSPPSPPSPPTTDPRAYKCVPFDPDSQIKDGHILIDTATGAPLSKVIAERQVLRDERTGQTMPPVILKMIEVMLGILLGLTVLAGIVFLFVKFISPSTAVPNYIGPAFMVVTLLVLTFFGGMATSIFLPSIS